MTTMRRQHPNREASRFPPRLRTTPWMSSTPGFAKRTFPVTDNDQSSESGQSHVVSAPHDDREHRIALAAYLRAERRGFVPGAELEDWLAAENEDDSRSST